MSRIIQFGRPGTGKTTMLRTLKALGLHCVLIDADKKAQEMDMIKPLIDKGWIKHIPMQSKLLESDLKARILQPKARVAKQPQGYIEFLDILNQIEKDCAEGKYGDSRNDWAIATDSWTRVQEHMKRLILYTNGRGMMEIQDWNVILSNMEEFFEFYYGLPFKHHITIFHSQTEKDELTGLTEVLPLIDGQMKHKASSYASEVYHHIVKQGRSGPEYMIQTVPIGRVAQARTSVGLKAEEPADYSIIFKGR